MPDMGSRRAKIKAGTRASLVFLELCSFGLKVAVAALAEQAAIDLALAVFEVDAIDTLVQVGKLALFQLDQRAAVGDATGGGEHEYGGPEQAHDSSRCEIRPLPCRDHHKACPPADKGAAH